MFEHVTGTDTTITLIRKDGQETEIKATGFEYEAGLTTAEIRLAAEHLRAIGVSGPYHLSLRLPPRRFDRERRATLRLLREWKHRQVRLRHKHRRAP